MKSKQKNLLFLYILIHIITFCYIYTGLCANQSENTEENLTKSEKIIEINQIILNAKNFSKNGEHNNAISEYMKVLEIQPQNKEVKIEIVKELILCNKYDEAVNMSNQLIYLYPEDTEMKNELSKLLDIEGKHDEAISQINKISETPEYKEEKPVDKESPTELEQRKESEERKEVLEAEKSEEPIKLQPDNLENKIELAKVLSWSGRYKESIELYRKILEEKPENIDVRKQLAAVLSWSKEYDKSIEEYNKIIKATPDDLEAKFGLAKVLSWSKRYRESISVYNDLLIRNPEEISYRLGLADVLRWSGNKKKAENEYRISVKICRSRLVKNPEDVELKHTLARAFAGAGDYKEAEKLYYELLEKDKTKSDYYTELGNIYNQKGQISLAKKSYELALKVNPGSEDAKKMLREINLSLLNSAEQSYYFLEDSEHTKTHKLQTSLIVPISISTKLTVEHTNSMTRDLITSVRRETDGFQFEKSFERSQKTRLNAGLKWNTFSKKTSNIREKNINFSAAVTDQIFLGAGFREYAIVSTPRVILLGISSKDSQFYTSYSIDKIVFYGSVVEGKISDMNRKKEVDLSISYNLKPNFSINYSYFFLDYRYAPNNGYWSPEGYISNKIGFIYSKRFTQTISLNTSYNLVLHGERGFDKEIAHNGDISLNYTPNDRLVGNLWIFKSNSSISKAEAYSSFQTKLSLKLKF